jgi:hypothetical protein
VAIASERHGTAAVGEDISSDEKEEHEIIVRIL